MLEYRLEPIIKEHVSTAFKKIDDPALEKAVADAFVSILADRRVIDSLTKEISRIQDFEKRRRDMF